MVNVNTSVIGQRPPLDLSTLIDPAGRGKTLDAACTGRRQVFLDGAERDTAIYAREKLPADAALHGPAVIEQMDTTILVEPGDAVTSDAQGNLMIEVAQ